MSLPEVRRWVLTSAMNDASTVAGRHTDQKPGRYTEKTTVHGDTSDGRVTRTHAHTREPADKQLRTLFGEPRRLDRHTTVHALFVRAHVNSSEVTLYE